MKKIFYCVTFVLLVYSSVQAQQTEKLKIKNAAGTEIVLNVEIADTPAKRRTGLMFRKYLKKDAGMLFTFPRKDVFSMWMKNTYIPLDMFFIDENGKITDIAENTEPLSLKSVSPGKRVTAVLETNAGFAKENGIQTGDVVEHPFFTNTAENSSKENIKEPEEKAEETKNEEEKLAKKLSRKAKKTKKKEEQEPSVAIEEKTEEVLAEEEKKEKPKKRTRRIKSAKTST